MVKYDEAMLCNYSLITIYLFYPALIRENVVEKWGYTGATHPV
jgi:hypothetical protein